LIDAALVAPAKEVGGEKDGNTGPSHFCADQACAESNRVGIIMLPGQRRRKRLVDLRAAAGRVAVCRDCNTNPRAANCDSAFSAAREGLQLASHYHG
jgi:hypothetical protein